MQNAKGERPAGRHWLCCLALLCCCSFLPAQGLIFDDETYGAMPRQSTFGDGSRTESRALEGIKKWDLKPYVPKIQHQGWVSTCVGWSAGYGAYSTQKAIQNNWKNQQDLITEQAYSALFIFNQIKITDCSFGSRISDALLLLKNKGNVFSKSFDAEKENCDKEPTPADLAFAADHKIKDFMTLFSPDDEERIKVNKTKLSLVQNKPVIIGMNLLQNFASVPYRDSIWYPAIGNKAPYGGHAMVVVGFDDGLEAFEIMNSWGDTWANHGFVWIKYTDFAQYCKYGFQISMDELLAADQVYTGDFTFRRKVGRLNDGTILFKEETPVFNDEYYTFADTRWKVGTVFQLVVSQVNNGMYLYAFSIDPDNQIKVHWPRDGKLDAKFEGLNESALITVPEVELYIPGKDRAFSFDKPGSDYICLLYSTRPITDFNDKLRRIGLQKGNPLERIYKTFGKEMAPLDQMNYAPGKMAFRNPIPSGSIIPMVLEVAIAP